MQPFAAAAQQHRHGAVLQVRVQSHDAALERHPTVREDPVSLAECFFFWGGDKHLLFIL